jgi:hypothetical protein
MVGMISVRFSLLFGLFFLVSRVSSQAMSLSLAAPTSQLFCYTPPPPSTPLLCAQSQEIFEPKSFKRVTANAPWSPRAFGVTRTFPRPLTFVHVNGTAIVLPNNSLVTVSGANGALFSTNINDIWASGDGGYEWFLIAGKTSTTHAYGEYANTSITPLYSTAAVSDRISGQVWLIAGYNNRGRTNLIWTSTNMIEWRSYTPLITARSGAAACRDTNGNMYLVGGSVTDSRFLNDVWSSRDGVNWIRVSAQALFPARYLLQLVAIQTSIMEADVLIIAGGDAGTQYNDFNDVWQSSNAGQDWTLITANAPFPPRMGFIMAVTSSNTLIITQGYVARSSSLTTLANDVFVSFDAAYSWYQCSHNTPLARWGATGTLDAEDHLFLLGGTLISPTWTLTYDVWRSTIPFNDRELLSKFCHRTVANVVQLDSNLTFSNDTDIIHAPNIPLLNTTLSSPSIVQLSSSRSMVCMLRTDHSILCTDPTQNNISSSLSRVCPWSNLSTYACGVGRLGLDGFGWKGSANGDVLTTNLTADGYSYISVNAVNLSSVGLFLLTSPDHHPSYYGESSLQWNYTLNADQFTDRYCISPIFNSSHSERMRSVTIRRHIRLQNLLHSPVQSLCGDKSKACGLLMNGTIVCWHSAPLDDAPISVSPPSYITFAQLECGIDSLSDTMTYACAIMANPGMTGRVLCWNVSGSTNDMLLLDNMTYWMYATMFQHVDIVIQQDLFNVWTNNDQSIAGAQQCLDASPIQPDRSLMNHTLYLLTEEAKNVEIITQQILFKYITCAHWSVTCTFLSVDDALYQMDHLFRSSSTITSLSSDSHLTQVVALSNFVFDTSVSLHITPSNVSFLSFDAQKTRSNTGMFSDVFSDVTRFVDVVDDSSSSLLCGLITFPNSGQFMCNKPLPTSMTSLENVAFVQVRVGVSSSRYTSPSLGLCAQRLNDSHWHCAEAAVPEILPSVNTTTLVPVSTGVPMGFNRITSMAPWSPRFDSKVIIYPRSISFNHTNGSAITFPRNSLVMTAYSTVGLVTPVANDVWLSSDVGKTYVPPRT